MQTNGKKAQNIMISFISLSKIRTFNYKYVRRCKTTHGTCEQIKRMSTIECFVWFDMIFDFNATQFNVYYNLFADNDHAMLQQNALRLAYHCNFLCEDN